MKMIKCLLCFLLFFILIAPVLGDGMIVIDDRDMWQLHNERQQMCAINYENSYQNMILSVDTDELRGEQAVWIFPVPAKPEETVIDIMKGFPNLHGYDIKKKVDSEIKGAFSSMRLTQIYTFFELRKVVYSGKAMMEGITAATAANGRSVVVHEHIEKMGLVTELVTAKEGTAFWNWLTLRGLELPEDAKSVFNEYIGEEYSFVISWISDIEEFKANQAPYRRPYHENYYNTNILGVFVKFPTDKIYYPLKPTSVYGSLRVPALIYIMDFVKPELYTSIEQDSDITYYAQDRYYVPDDLKELFNNKNNINDLRYTKISLNPPSKYLTDDLWFELGAPAGISIANCIIQNTLWFGLLFFIICSLLASFISGMIFFRKDKVSKLKLTLWGLWNFLTIIGFIIATVFMKTRKTEISPKLAAQLKQKGLAVKSRSDSRKIWFVIVFSVIFVVLTYLFQNIMTAVF